MLRKDDFRGQLSRTGGTANPAEIARFDALAEEWWKPHGAFKVVHAFNRARVDYLASQLPKLFGRDAAAVKPLLGLHVIDVGCGAGIVTEAMAQYGATVLGIDAAERNIAIARRHAESVGADVQYRHALPEDLADLAGSFDAVLSLEVVEHVGDQVAFVAALARLVRPGGILVIGTINRTVRSFIKAILGAEYILGWLPKGTHDWRRFVTPGELDLYLRHDAFTLEARTGVSFDFLRRRWITLADDSALYMRLYRKP